MQKFHLQLALAVLAATMAPAAGAEQKPGDATHHTAAMPAELVGNLIKGGYVIYLRHTATDRRTGDFDRKNLKNCVKQRILSTRGRRQAANIGDGFRKLRIPVGKIVSSPYCRCMDTARLAFGRVKAMRGLLFALNNDRAETAWLSKSLRRLMAAPPAPRTNTVIVGHTWNLHDVTKIWAKPEGVAVIFKPGPGGSISYVATVHPDSWLKTAHGN